MAYFIFLNNTDNVESTLYRIAENQSDLNNLNINLSTYKIIEDSQSNFESVKYGTKEIIKYNNNTITYADTSPISIEKKKDLELLIDSYKKNIQSFIKYNPNHPLLNRWNNYYNQLNSSNLDSITYPFNKTLEKHFNDLGQPSLHPLQLP
jgi:hypothetical protein